MYRILNFYDEETVIFRKINYKNMYKIITSFSTEVNIELCHYIKKTIEGDNSNLTAD
jgi:hypothetical protein